MPPEPVLIQPASAAEVAAALRRASDARQSVVIRGADTKRGWGRTPAHVDCILDMRRMNRILAHQHGDLTATVEAGATLGEVNDALAIHGQTLPLDPPFADRATIGGLLATNDSGPLRHRYGTPRDLVIGIHLATTDGVLSKAGGQVVKNVAGYDLSKLVTGSFGSLAAIVGATFKLAPLPAASKTMTIAARDLATLADAIRTVMASQLEPVAFEVVARAAPAPARGADLRQLLLRFASLPAAVDAQIAQATTALKPFATAIHVDDTVAERALWHAHAGAIWNQPGAVVRASWLPAGLERGLRELGRLHAELARDAGGHGGIELVGRAAIGAGLIRIDGDTAAQASVVRQLRASPDFGNIVIVRGSSELKAIIDVWGPHGTRQPLFDALKRAFDPHGVLNAGRGPL